MQCRETVRLSKGLVSVTHKDRVKYPKREMSTVSCVCVCISVWYRARNIMMIIQIILTQSLSPIIFISEEFNFKLHSNNDTSHTGSGLANF